MCTRLVIHRVWKSLKKTGPMKNCFRRCCATPHHNTPPPPFSQCNIIILLICTCLPLFGISTNIHEPSKLEGRWLALSSSAQADFHAVECTSTPCQFCARLCTSDCSKSGLVGGLDRITCAHKFHVTNLYLRSASSVGPVTPYIGLNIVMSACWMAVLRCSRRLRTRMTRTSRTTSRSAATTTPMMMPVSSPDSPPLLPPATGASCDGELATVGMAPTRQRHTGGRDKSPYYCRSRIFRWCNIFDMLQDRQFSGGEIFGKPFSR